MFKSDFFLKEGGKEGREGGREGGRKKGRQATCEKKAEVAFDQVKCPAPSPEQWVSEWTRQLHT